VLVAVAPLSVSAQAPRTQVIVTGDAIAVDVWEILQGAFARDGIALSREAIAPDCAGTIASPELRAQVWITWSPGSSAQLCFQDHCQTTSRTLGPFAKLDARAREALITVIESGLAAMRSACLDSDSSRVAERALSERAASGATPPAPPTAAGGSPAVDGGGVARTASAAPAAGLPPKAQAQAGEPEQGANATQSASESPSGSDKPSDRASSASSGPTDTSSSFAGPRFSFGASYGFMRWNAQTLTQVVAGLVAYAIHPMPLHVGTEVGYAPALRAEQDDLAIHGTGLRIALLLGSGLQLSQRFSLDAQVGLAIQWLWLAPSSGTANLVTGTRSVSHADPALLVRIGPSLQLLSALRVGLDFCLDASWVERSYGFASTAGSLEVFAPDPLRFSLAIYARVVL
jgi:hypothetical protein